MTKKVALITTGGTIASKRNSEDKLESGKLNGEEILKMCKIESDINITLIDLFQVPSMHMSYEKLNQLTATINSIIDDYDGIVVTHGTDSLEETSYFLELTTNNKNPIIITGSQKSPEDIGTDVYSNLRDSILVAINPNSKNLGAVVVFNGQIFHSKYVRKIHSSSINGFGSIGYGRLGYIDNDEVIIYQKPYTREFYEIKESYPHVEVVYSFLGSSDFILNVLKKSEVQGIVLVGSGRGQVTDVMYEGLQIFDTNETKIVLVTSTEEGRVYPTYDYKGSANSLLKMGVIMGGDYDVKKARIKLMLMLANEIEDYNKFQ